MKSKKQLIVGIIVLLMLIIPTISKANMEIKSGTTTWTKISVSDAYMECINLSMEGSSLGTDKLDPHLALNKDWGAVAYLALSVSGAVNTKTGPSVTIDGESYTTTTGNLTGVMNFGKTNTFTSSSIVAGLEKESSNNQYRTNLIKNKNTKYVETLPDSATTDNTKGMAISETGGWFGVDSRYGPNADLPMSVRSGGVLGLFDYSHGGYGGYGGVYGRS